MGEAPGPTFGTVGDGAGRTDDDTAAERSVLGATLGGPTLGGALGAGTIAGGSAPGCDDEDMGAVGRASARSLPDRVVGVGRVRK